jgi:peptidoglycan/LPS O-acetylase OafA/YrhL
MPTDVRSSFSAKHLPFLDGIRGIAAIYVFLHHAVAISISFDPLRGTKHLLLQWTQYGQIAVAIFIVLSGFCLMLPVADLQSNFRGGLPRFFYRRARRILPPYYAAMALSLFLIWMCGPLEPSRQQLSHTTLIAHLLLLHNVNADWNHAINGPMWSVATEWQIYFVFALVLLPIQRKFG